MYNIYYNNYAKLMTNINSFKKSTQKFQITVKEIL